MVDGYIRYNDGQGCGQESSCKHRNQLVTKSTRTGLMPPGGGGVVLPYMGYIYGLYVIFN